MICDRQNYTTEIGYECLNCCIYNYLFNEQLNIHKSEIFFYGEGFNVFYNTLEDFPAVSSLMYESNFTFLKKAGIHFSVGYLKNSESAVEFLSKCIKEEILISIKVESNNLMYDSIFAKSNAAPHFINPLGINIASQKIFISDGYIPNIVPTVYQGWVDLEQVIRAWAAKDYYYVCINPTNELSLKKPSIERGAEKEFIKGIRRYLDSSHEGTIGYTVLFKLLCELESYLKEENQLFNQFALKINYQLKVYGFLTIKKYISDFLKLKKLPSSFCAKYDEIIEKWYYIDKYLIKVGITKSHLHMTSLIEKIQKLSYEENAVLHDIADFCTTVFDKE